MTGAGSTWSNSSGVNIGNLGTGTLTIADGGIVNGPIVIATNAGAIGTLNIGAGAGNPAAAPGTLTAPSLAFGAGTGTLNFNHTSANYVFAPAISGNGTVNVLAGTTILTGANTYTGGTTISAGTLQLGNGGTTGSIVGQRHSTTAFSPSTAPTLHLRGRDLGRWRVQPDRHRHDDPHRRQHLHRRHDDQRRHAAARQRRHERIDPRATS